MNPILIAALLAMYASSVAAAPVMWHGATEIAVGRGEKGPWRQNDSRYNYVDDPAATLDRSGNVAVAWVEQGHKDVFFQRLSPDGGKQPAEPINVSRSPETFSWLPRVVRAPDSENRLYILWQEIIFSGGSHGGDILFAYSNDNGATFSQPINISRSAGGDGKGRINRDIWHNGSLDLAAGYDGAVYVAWTEYGGTLWFSRSLDGGGSFSAPRPIAGTGDGKPARAPSLATGKGGTLHLAWTTGENDKADIQLATSRDGGASFGEPRSVAASPGYSDAPKLAIGPDGVLHLAYAQSRGGPFDRYEIHYTRSPDGNSFDAPRNISNPLPGSIESAAFPSLNVDAAGRVYVVYELFPHHRRPPRGLGITVSADGGKTFAAPSVVPYSSDPAGGSNGGHQGLLMDKLAVNCDGSVAIVNSSLLQGVRSRVWLIQGEIESSGAGR